MRISKNIISSVIKLIWMTILFFSVFTKVVFAADGTIEQIKKIEGDALGFLLKEDFLL